MAGTRSSPDGGARRRNPQIIIAQKPSKSSRKFKLELVHCSPRPCVLPPPSLLSAVHHQSSVHSSDESDAWEDVQSHGQTLATSLPPRPPSPSHSASFSPAVRLTPPLPAKKTKKKEKRKKSGLFRWRKKKAELEPPAAPVDQYSSYESESEGDNIEFVDILMDPSRMRGSVSIEGSEKLVSPVSCVQRSNSDSAVRHNCVCVCVCV